MRVVVLGCGTGGGVPRIGGDWGACDPHEPRNRRRRASIHIEAASTHLLVDTSPDLRDQLLDTGLSAVDAVLYTHEHADHSHGIDDLRYISYRQGRPVPAYADARTLDRLRRRFGYAFETPSGSFYKPIAEGRVIDGPFTVGGVAVVPFVQGPGAIDTLGFRIGDFAYSTDVTELSEEAFATLDGIAVWLVDCLGRKPHPTHAHLDKTLEWIARVRPARAVLTHMSSELDYRTLCAELPAGVEPAYDGMALDL